MSEMLPGPSPAPTFAALRAAADHALAALSALLARRALTLDDAGELLTTVLLLVVGFAASASPVSPTSFVERDATLSQRFLGDTVPTAVLVAVAVVLPGAAAAAIVAHKHFFDADDAGADAETGDVESGFLAATPDLQRLRLRRRRALLAALWLALSLAQALAVTLAATNCLKNAFGRQRPSFFQLSDYAGYGAAVASPQGSPQWASYMASTSDSAHEVGYLGTLAKAAAAAPQLTDAQRSFPSGHASLSFAGLGWLCGLLRRWLRVGAGRWLDVRALLAALPLVLAASVAVSRYRDNKHFTDDVSVGAAIGGLGAALAWSQFASEEQRRDPLMLRGGRRGACVPPIAPAVVAAPPAAVAAVAAAAEAPAPSTRRGEGRGSLLLKAADGNVAYDERPMLDSSAGGDEAAAVGDEDEAAAADADADAHARLQAARPSRFELQVEAI